jgi:hypothetical protein
MTRHPSTRRLRRPAAALVGILLLTACGAASPDAASDLPVPSGSTSSTPPPTETEADLPRFMPDLLGMDYDDARRELVDYNVRVTKEELESPEEVGTVIAQDPESGEDFSQDVTLTVAIAPPDVPDVVGMTFGAASQELGRLGFTFTETTVFDERERDGLVLEQDPPAGATNAGEVNLTVSRRPIVGYLADQRPVSTSSSALESGTWYTNGEPYTHALKVPIGRYSADSTVIEYDLSRDYRQLLGAVGLEDRSVGGTTFKVEIYGDDRSLFDSVLALGQVQAVDLDITGVLRLEVVVTRISGEGAVVLADVRALGLEDEVDTNPTATPTPTSRS